MGAPAAQTWADTIDFPALGLRVQLEKGRALFRDDGLFRGDLSLHTRDLQAEPGLAGLAGAGKLSEGLVAVGTGPDGVRRAVVYALATDHPADDEARREGLRAAAAIRLGCRADLERFFLSQGIRLPMRTTSDGVLAAMVEVYALVRAGRPIQWLDGADRQQAAAMLMARGIGEQ